MLVERFVRSVTEDDLRPDQILAITFTEKAAGELRTRVRERFLELGRRDDARDTEAAWVSTIHGFCARVLRAHAVAAGLDPGFAVLDDPGARALRGRAFEAALAQFLGDDRPAALELVAAYRPDRLQTMVCGVHETLRSRGQTRPALPPPRPADLGAARAALAAAARAAQAHLAASGRSLRTIDRAREAVAGCIELLDAGASPPGHATLAGLDAKPGGVAELAAPEYERYRASLAAFAQACRDARALEPVALIDELLGRYADAYAEAKRERALLDFTDLELKTRDLLEAAPAIAADYASRFARVMVDEFQDTNPLQLALLDRLDRDNVFVVGDALQSIYGFRHADVRGFERRRRRHEAAGTAAALTTSFRARPEILVTLQAAFGDLHGPEQQPLVAGRSEPPAGEPLVELLVVDAPAFDRAGQDPAPLGACRAVPRRRGAARRRPGARARRRRRLRSRRGRDPPARGRQPAGLRARAAGGRVRDAAQRGARLVGPARGAGPHRPPRGRWPTRATSSRSSACWPRRWSGCRPTPWRCWRWRRTGAGAGCGVWPRTRSADPPAAASSPTASPRPTASGWPRSARGSPPSGAPPRASGWTS